MIKSKWMFVFNLSKKGSKMKSSTQKLKLFKCIVIGLVFLFNLPAAQAAEYPEKPITLVVPSGAGGGLDRDARGILPYLQKHLPVPVVIVYKPGGGSRIGNDYVFTSPPDGYTLGIISLPGNIVGELMYKTKYKINEFTHIYAWARMNNSLFVNVKTGKHLMNLSKRHAHEKLPLAWGPDWARPRT